MSTRDAAFTFCSLCSFDDNDEIGHFMDRTALFTMLMCTRMAKNFFECLPSLPSAQEPKVGVVRQAEIPWRLPTPKGSSINIPLFWFQCYVVTNLEAAWLVQNRSPRLGRGLPAGVSEMA